jgi:carbonic anhydrase
MPTDQLLTGHRRFKERFEADRERFVRLAEEGQQPEVLWIGCSDSRVIPEQITGAEPAELFVMRNIANVVPPFGTGDMAVGAVIEYAVLHLHAPHVVICGHTQCGGIKALEGHVDLAREPHIARWVEWARAQYEQDRPLPRAIPKCTLPWRRWPKCKKIRKARWPCTRNTCRACLGDPKAARLAGCGTMRRIRSRPFVASKPGCWAGSPVRSVGQAARGPGCLA